MDRPITATEVRELEKKYLASKKHPAEPMMEYLIDRLIAVLRKKGLL